MNSQSAFDLDAANVFKTSHATRSSKMDERVKTKAEECSAEKNGFRNVRNSKKCVFLLDTNILIPLENSQVVLEESLAHFVRLANEHGHQLVYHPASEDDISRDTNSVRRGQNGRTPQTITFDSKTGSLAHGMSQTTNPNDRADNEILYALKCESAHALVTEDRGIHDKAKRYGLIDRVYTIQTARDWLRRLHEKINVRLPNIEDRELSYLTPLLASDFFHSLRQAI